jgi:hypothetical protein
MEERDVDREMKPSTSEKIGKLDNGGDASSSHSSFNVEYMYLKKKEGERKSMRGPSRMVVEGGRVWR